jgi:hypothetical protein
MSPRQLPYRASKRGILQRLGKNFVIRRRDLDRLERELREEARDGSR